ncbi:hypothetical protein N180_01940 [Pedobacter antarcticus 4BY]|uniref:DUF1292 domain-containing protein n=2 Tax=Pedobacter antarcticus TaxID=34086 RepID=A0A081PCJ4_9SPHI|nr:hypothetical protein [Pedobacter antarcticus]KEQ28417.1 hypothetical protein N180_01940 [Pedobacter antarcticus 4BY]SFF04518.1 hypothetical protein SAMN03003324_02228 [Pedobacter antarcticus]
MEDIIYNFTVSYEGAEIQVRITETEIDEEVFFYVEIPGEEKFEIFLSEDDEWVTNDENGLEEDLILLIGDKFESMQS